MVRQRSKKSEESIEAFGAGADQPAVSLDKKAPRNYKSLTIKMNEYEFNRLKVACDSADRGVLDFVRQAIKSAVEKA
jgi:hypothetical protein